MTIKLHSFNGRDLYHAAWKFMYFSDKDKYKAKIYDEVNPMANKKLGTEVDVWSVVAYDDCVFDWSPEEIMEYTIKNSVAIKKSGIDVMERGIPVGVQSWVVTKSKIIGKQMIVDPNYERKGICTAMILESGKHLKGCVKETTGNAFDTAYIGCSQYSKPIFERKFGIEPFNSSVEHDLYKFNVPMELLTSDELYNKLVVDRGFELTDK